MSQNDQQPHRTTFPKAWQTKVKLIWKRIVALTFQIQVAVDTSDSFKFYWFYPLTTTSTAATICKIEQTIFDSSIHQDIAGIMKMKGMWKFQIYVVLWFLAKIYIFVDIVKAERKMCF